MCSTSCGTDYSAIKLFVLGLAIMKKLLGILVIGLLFCSIGYAKTKITEVKRSIKEDGEGILKLKEFHALNAPHAINPVSVSDFSIIG